MAGDEIRLKERRQEYLRAETLVRETVHETLTGLGFDLRDPTGIQADVAYLRKARRGSEQVANIAKRTCIGVVCSGGLWAMWEGIKVGLGIRGGGS